MQRAKPYQSLFEQHYEFIRDGRRARKTWVEIASALKQRDMAINASANSILQWFKRRQKRTSLPLGFEDAPPPLEPQTPTTSAAPVKTGTAALSSKSQEQVAKLLKAPAPPPSDPKWNLINNESTPLTKKTP